MCKVLDFTWGKEDSNVAISMNLLEVPRWVIRLVGNFKRKRTCILSQIFLKIRIRKDKVVSNINLKKVF